MKKTEARGKHRLRLREYLMAYLVMGCVVMLWSVSVAVCVARCMG